MSLQAYQRTRKITESPRAMEARLVGQITGAMLDAQSTGLRGAQLMPILHRNREMWGIFAASCSAAGNELPDDLRARMVSLALWVDRFTSDVIAGREPIGALIDVNRAVFDGLSNERLAA
ncbi:MAG: flagellar biosynthesis regulator FlaF [Sphingomonas sp.]